MKKPLLEINYSEIEFAARSQYIYNHAQLGELYNRLKNEQLIPQALSFLAFYEYLLKMGLVKFQINFHERSISRFSFDKQIDIYRLMISLKKGSFFSMSTALNLNGYSNYRNEFIFVSCELPKKELNCNVLKQDDIDSAFRKPYRRTQYVGKFNGKNIVLLTPKYSKNFAVTNGDFPAASINRALVEMIINVQYFRTSLEIIHTYIPLKSNIEIKEVFSVIDAFDLIYPYFQCVGFYLEKIGFKKRELGAFKEKVSNLKFYTDKSQEDYLFDDYWQIYYLPG